MRDPDIFDTLAERAFAGEKTRHVRASLPPLRKCAARARRRLVRLTAQGARLRAVQRQTARVASKEALEIRRREAWEAWASK